MIAEHAGQPLGSCHGALSGHADTFEKERKPCFPVAFAPDKVEKRVVVGAMLVEVEAECRPASRTTAFGAFVDIGVHQDGLVHVSQLADRFVKDPAEVVSVRQRVTVTVLDVDVARKRIALSMRSNPAAGASRVTR